MSKNKSNWDRIYKDKGFMFYPNESLVVSYHKLKSLLPKHVVALDYGFGSGNNSEFMINNVDELYGIEISPQAKKVTSIRLKNYPNFNEYNFVISENTLIPTFKKKFDLIVAWHVLSYNSHDSVKEVISQLKSYLKPGGILVTTLATPRDISMNYSNKTSHNTYIITDKIADQEGCQVIIPQSNDDFNSYFKNFKIIDSGFFEKKSSISDYSHSHFYGIFQK